MNTIEEKAKAYDEIIERAKTMLAAGEVMYGKENNASQLITDLIPELRESEDERIYNEIMEFFKMNEKRCIVDNSYTRWIAWLERQKEQKPVERAIMRDFNYHEGEPDEKAWSRLFAILNYAEATSDDTPEEEIQALTNWIEGKQKPVEWSEDDERKLNDVICIVEKSGLITSYREHYIRFLKSLRPSWKPSEEQMEALHKAAKKAYHDYDARPLESLYSDLLKLK